MVINEIGILSGVGVLATLGTILRLLPKEFTKYLSMTLFFFVALELVLSFVPYDLFGTFWWFLHAPSVTMLGVDEILERHGWFISTAAHAADLLLWSCLSAIIIIESLRKKKLT